MSRHRLWALAALTLVLPALLAAPAASDDDAAYQRISAGTAGSDTGGSASFHVKGCFGDPTGDTVRLPDETPEYSERSDITEVCIDHRADATDLMVVIPLGTDPATDPGWDDEDAGVAMQYRTADGDRREVQISTQRKNGVLEYIVLQGTFSSTIVCSGPARFEEGGTYFAAVPADCMEAPETLEAQVLAVYDGFNDGVRDYAPADGGTLAIPRSVPAGADRVTRLAGDDRIQTALEVSQAGFTAGTANAVLLAAAGNFPDAVVGAPLAAAINAPVLLVNKASVPQGVIDEVARVLGGAGDVRILGGPSAVGSDVVETFEEEGHTVTRLSGDGRIDTSLAIASAAVTGRGSEPRSIFLADGGNFADALLAGAYAPLYNGVAVLVNSASIPSAVQSFAEQYPDARVIGIGPAAAALTPDSGVAGRNPAETSALLASVIPGVEEVGVATYENFPDGLAGGAFTARGGFPLLLSPTDVMSGEVRDYLERRAPLQRVTLFGGTVALSDTVAGQAAQHLG